MTLRRTVVLGLLVSCAAFAQDGGAAAPVAPPAAPAAAPAEAVSPAARLDELWKVRDQAEAIKECDKIVTDALKATPDDYDLLWRAARWRWWVADGTSDDQKSLRKTLGKEAWGYADRAIKAKPDGLEGHYFKALGVGAYSQGVGIMTAISEGLEAQFNDNLDFALKKNEKFDTSGPLRAKGRSYWELPWPKRDLAKSKDLLEKAAKNHPEQLRTYLYLAETLLKDGKAKEASVQINKAMTGKIAWDPPEGRRVQKWALPVAKAIQEELD